MADCLSASVGWSSEKGLDSFIGISLPLIYTFGIRYELHAHNTT